LQLNGHSPSSPLKNTRFFSSHLHLEKKELKLTRGAEDHFEYIAVELALGRQHALQAVHRKGRLGPSREKRGQRLDKFDATQCIDWMRERPFVLFRERDEEQRSV
jgi:hypothetical protein